MKNIFQLIKKEKANNKLEIPISEKPKLLKLSDYIYLVDKMFNPVIFKTRVITEINNPKDYNLKEVIWIKGDVVAILLIALEYQGKLYYKRIGLKRHNNDFAVDESEGKQLIERLAKLLIDAYGEIPKLEEDESFFVYNMDGSIHDYIDMK